MPPRLRETRSALGDILIYDRGTGPTDKPISLHLDDQKPGFAIHQRYLPTTPGVQGGVTLSEWTWQNGEGGAGTTIETPTSKAQGASDFGENCWLRRIGAAQPAGRLREIQLPAGTAATTGRIRHGQVFNDDLWLTTESRYLVRVYSASGDDGADEYDFGSSATTSGLAVWKYAGASNAHLYAGCVNAPIQEWDGSAWTAGETETKRSNLETPYWTIGANLATGGLAGTSGTGASRLVGLHTQGLGFYHCAGDPKLAANWSSLTPVGTGGSYFPLLGTVASNRQVWFASGLGVFGVDEVGYSPNYTKWVELNADNHFTGFWATYWAGLVWFNTPQGLACFSPDGSRQDLARSFRFGAASGVSAMFGLHQAMAPCEDGLYVGIYNQVTGDSYVGLLMLDEQSGQFRWSMAEAVLRDQNVTFIQQVTDSSGVPRLFIGTQDADSNMHLFVQDLPRSGDPEADYQSGGAFLPARAWSIQCSRFNGGEPVLKTARRYMVEADQLGDGFPTNEISVTVANDGGAFTEQGIATVSPRWSGQPIVGTAQATSMQLRLDVTNDEDAPVVIRTASILYSSHPELSPAVTAPFIVGEGHPGEEPRSLIQRLERAQRAGPLIIDDFFGRRIEGTISIENVDIVPEAAGKGWTIKGIVTLLYTRRVSHTSVGDTTDGGYTAS